jgi:hypothetical protein
MEGTNSIKFTPAAGFTTGKIGTFDIGSTLDLSSFSAIHCYFNGSGVAQVITMKLCSDAGGTTVVNTMTFDCKAASLGLQNALFLNGAALSSTVRSIVIEISADPGTTALNIDCIAACHDPAVTPNSITPYSAFSTSSSVANNFSLSQDCSWQSIRCFLTDTTACLNGSGAAGTPTNCKWPHATVTSGTLYVLHGTQSNRLSGSGGGGTQCAINLQEAGTEANPTVYVGGYNRTDMSTQDTDGMTVIVITNTIAGGPFKGMAFTELQRFIFIVPGNNGPGTFSSQFKMTDCAFIGLNVIPYQINNVKDCKHTNLSLSCCADNTAMTLLSNGASDRTVLKNVKATNVSLSITFACGLQIDGLWQRRSTTRGVVIIGGDSRLGYNGRDWNLGDNTTADLGATSQADIRLNKVTCNSSAKLSSTAGHIMIQDYNGDSSAVAGVAEGFSITKDTSTVDGTAVSSLRLLVNVNTFTSTFPVSYQGPPYRHPSSISGASVTVSMRIKKTHATNIAGRLCVRGGIILSDKASTSIPSDTNWNTVEVSFTPTADGQIEVFFELWSTGTTESIYFNPESLSVTVT